MQNQSLEDVYFSMKDELQAVVTNANTLLSMCLQGYRRLLDELQISITFASVSTGAGLNVVDVIDAQSLGIPDPREYYKCAVSAVVPAWYVPWNPVWSVLRLEQVIQSQYLETQVSEEIPQVQFMTDLFAKTLDLAVIRTVIPDFEIEGFSPLFESYLEGVIEVAISEALALELPPLTGLAFPPILI